VNGIRNVGVLVVALGLCGVAWSGGDDKLDKKSKARVPAQLDWVSYGEALERAVAEDKHIVVDFYTKWCGWCKVMDRKTYADPAVVEMLNENFLVAKINAESSRKFPVGEREMSGRDVAKQYGVRQFPMTWFVKPDGDRLANIPGFIPPERFIKALEYVHERRYDKPNTEQRQAKEQQ
jgi:thioredoxin-related protein